MFEGMLSDCVGALQQRRIVLGNCDNRDASKTLASFFTTAPMLGNRLINIDVHVNISRLSENVIRSCVVKPISVSDVKNVQQRLCNNSVPVCKKGMHSAELHTRMLKYLSLHTSVNLLQNISIVKSLHTVAPRSQTHSFPTHTMGLSKFKPTSPKREPPSAKKPAHFLNLPRKLRQSIILYTYDEDTPLHKNPFIDNFLERKKFLENHIKLRQLIHPSLSEDLHYAKKRWQTSYHNKADELKKEARRGWDTRHSAPFGVTLLWDLPYYYNNIEAFGFRIRTMKWEVEHPAMKQVRCMKRTRVSRLVYRIFTPKHPADLDRRFPSIIYDRNLQAWLYFMGIFTL